MPLRYGALLSGREVETFHGVDDVLAWPPSFREYDEETVTGELMAEVAARGLAAELVEAGDTKFTHSGGEVVLRCIPGLASWVVLVGGKACDEARRWTPGRGALGWRVAS